MERQMPRDLHVRDFDDDLVAWLKRRGMAVQRKLSIATF
jgi:hypothetical protein